MSKSPNRLYDHTALGFWDVADEIDWFLGFAESMEDETVDVGDSLALLSGSASDLQRADFVETLWACAGLTSYQELLASFASDTALDLEAEG